MTTVKRVLVVGAGIGGLTLATALRKRGIESEIVEITPDRTVQGIGIALQAPTMRALNEIGVIDRCVEIGFPSNEMSICDVAGNVMNTMPLPRVLGPSYPATLGIFRPGFQQILADAAEDAGVPLRLGTTVSVLQQSDDGVDVELSDGSRDRYDLVVGADGIFSTIRKLVFDSNVEPVPSGQLVWRATIDRPPEVDRFMMFFGPRNKSGFNPVSHEEMYVLLVQNPPYDARIPDAQMPGELREQLSDFGGLMADAREQIKDPKKIHRRPVEVAFSPAPWYRGRVVLMGDAAHATTPHLASGAGMAIEDAIVLSEELAARPKLNDALEGYMTRRYERSRMVYDNSIQLGKWEMNPADPSADPAGLTAKSFGILAQPI